MAKDLATALRHRHQQEGQRTAFAQARDGLRLVVLAQGVIAGQ